MNYPPDLVRRAPQWGVRALLALAAVFGSIAVMLRPASSAAATTAGLVLACALASCSVFKSNEEAQAILAQRIAGMTAGQFFDTYGRAKKRYELANGSVEYYWESQVGSVPAGPAGLDERVCKLNLLVTKDGRIDSVTIAQDNPGRMSTSRCGELFKGK